MTTQPWHFSLDSTLATIRDTMPDQHFHYPLRHGTMRIGASMPQGVNVQTPHDQDELYIVASGRGDFVKNGARVAFAPGDAIFVEAGAEHHFENFSEDFITWIIFWGPKGGEAGQTG
jgi:mannose-6-phosphate isomerase-like protein (cupin superfamily)